MNAMSCFVADGHSSIDCVNQPGVMSSFYGPSMVPRLGAGIMSFIAAWLCSVSVLKHLIPSSRLILGGLLCHAATWVAWYVPFPPKMASFMTHSVKPEYLVLLSISAIYC